MNWLKQLRATSIIRDSNQTLYTIASQHDFYDWSFNHQIPSNVQFKRTLPQLNHTNSDDLVISVTLPFYDIEKKKDGYSVKNSKNAQIDIKSGKADNLSELVEKNLLRQGKLNKDLETFKKTLLSQKYMVMGGDFLHMFRVANIKGDKIELDDLGYIEDLKNATQLHISSLKKNASHKTGRAHEMESLKRFETAMMNASGFKNINPSHMDVILASMETKPISQKSENAKDLFLQIHPEKQSEVNKLSQFFSASYVKSYLS